MTATCFEVERVDAVCERSFAETVATFEREVPAANMPAIAQLVASQASANDIETRVAAMVGDLAFMILGKVDQGPLVSLLGKPKKMSVYLVGNPVLANRMYEQHPGTGLYAPLRVAIYEDDGGTTHFTYEKPSTSLAQFQNETIRVVASTLDDKMGALTARVCAAS
jgi:uncharacterized protein (DUF302 family)